MPRDLEHLQLPIWDAPLPRRQKRSGPPVSRPSRRRHGENLLNQTAAVLEDIQNKRQTAPATINPRLVFKLQLNAKGDIDDEVLGRMKLHVLARSGSKVVVVFPDEEGLAELQRRITEYAGLGPLGQKYNELTSIDEIVSLSRDDRLGHRLREQPLAEDEIVALDIELWYEGLDQCRERIQQISTYLEQTQNDLRVTDSWIGQSICLVRARMNALTLNELLNVDYIKEIDRRPGPSFEMLEVVRMDAQQLQIPVDIADDLVGVVVIDSGVMQGHPLLGPTLGDAQVFPDRARERVDGNAADGDELTGGHGTAVAGIAVYNDVGACIAEREFTPSARLFSARVTNNRNEFDEDELAEHQLVSAVEYFLNNYPSARVFNISLGDNRLVCGDGGYQFRLAAVIDELAYQHRDREIVFTVSAGNYHPEHLTPEEILARYPEYLLNAEARVINPATSALAITVGGLSYGPGVEVQAARAGDIDRLIAGERGWPSPFTRIGWGLDSAIKPEVVDFAGDSSFERGRINQQPRHAGLPTTAKDFAPPEGRLFRTVSGTSFAAPKVANLCARLFREFPGASSNLIRALVASSAAVPSNRPASLTGLNSSEDRVVKIYGYGQPEFERARWSAQNSVILLDDNIIDIDQFRLYQLPPIPREFLQTPGDRYLTVCLAFDPPTRHTRCDSYFGVVVDFQFFRNIGIEAIAAALRQKSRKDLGPGEVLETLTNIRDENGFPIKIDLHPGINKRKKSTLQKAILRIGRVGGWHYDGGDLVLAVTCQRRWAPENITSQRYAVLVSLEHSDPEVELYNRIEQQTRVYQRVRIQV